MIENACPFAPGEVKPKLMRNALKREGFFRIGNLKLLLLMGSVLCLTILYSYSYSSLNWERSPFLFQDWYIVKMSIYTYLMGMITYYIRVYQKQKRMK